MTIEIPSGSKSMTLPNGMEVQIPNGAKTMDVPDELFKIGEQSQPKVPQAQNPIAQQQQQETKTPVAATTAEQPKKEYGLLEKAWDVATNSPVANFIPTKLKEWWDDDKTINHDSKIDNDFRHNVSALSNPNDPTLTGMVGEWTGSQTLKDLGKRNYSERDVADFRENVIRAAGDKYDVRFDAKTGDAYARPKGSDAEFEKVLNDIGDASWDEVGTRINANLAQVGTEVGMDIGAGVAFDRKYGKYIKHPALRFVADGLVATATAPISSAVGSVAQTAYSGEEISTKRLIEKSKEEAIDNTLATTAAMTGIGILSLGVRAAAKANPAHSVKGGKDEYKEGGLYEVPDTPDYIKAEDISLNPVTTVKNMEKRYSAESKAREDKLALIAKQKAEAEDIYKDFGGVQEHAEVIEMAGQSNAKEILGNHFNHSQERVNAEVTNSLKLTQNFKTAFNLGDKTSADLYRFMRGGMQRVKDFYTSYYGQAQDLILEEMGDDLLKISSETQAKLNELIKEARHPLNVENTQLSQAQKSEFNKDYQDLLELTKRDFTEDVPVWNEAKEAYEYVARDTKSYTLNGLFDVQKKFNAFLYKHKDKFTKPQKDALDSVKEAIYADVHRAIDTREMDDALKSEMKELWSDANKGYSNYKELTRRSDVLAKLVEDDVPFDVSKFATDVFKNINKRDAGDFDILYTFGKEIKKTGGDLDEFYTSVIDGLLMGAKDIKSPTGEISQGAMRTVKHQNQSLEIMDFDAFHKAFNSVDETTLKKIFGLSPRGEKILQHLKRFDDLASRESVLQQTLLNKEFKMSETAMQQHDQGKIFYSFAYGAKAMLWDSWAKYLMKNKAYEDFFLRAITKERYEDIEPLIKKLEREQREVPPIQRVDIEKLREDMQAAKEIAEQSFKQLKQIEEQSGKSTNAQQVEDVTISGLLEYKATRDPSVRDFDVERTHAKELATAEGMDASRIARVNNFDDLGREIRDFKLEQRERELGNKRSPSLASVSDEALESVVSRASIADTRLAANSRNMKPSDWEQLRQMGFTQEARDEFGASYEVLTEQGNELLAQESQRRAKEYKPANNEAKTFAGEKDAPIQIEKDDFTQFLQSNKPMQNTEPAQQMSPQQQVSSYELAKQEAQFFSELLKKVYKDSPLKELDESMKKYYNNFKEMFTTFQGGKAKMSLIVPQYISKVYTQEQRNAITTIDDLFGGGGTWGAFMGLQQDLFPNVKKLRIHEFNEFRALKISYLHHAPQKLIHILKNDQQVYDLIEGIKMTSIKGNSKSGQVGKGSHGYVAPYLNDMFANHIDQIRADYTQDQIAALYLIADYAARNEKNTRDLLDYLAGQVEGVARRSAQLKARGVEIEVYNHSSYDDWMPEQGNHVLNMIDPPYYKTKGYQIFKDGVKISDGEYVDIDLYEKTNKLIQKVKESGNLGIYTDEEWVRKPVDLPRGFKSKTDDGRVDYEVLKEISDNIDEFFVVPERIAEREEVLGFINAKGAKNDNSGNGGGAGVRTTNEANRDTTGDNRGNNNNSAGRMERPSQDDVRGGDALQGSREAEAQNRADAKADIEDEATKAAKEQEAQEKLKTVVQELNDNPPPAEELKALSALVNNVNFTQQVFMALRQSASGKPNQLNEYGAKLYLEAKEKYKDVLARKIDEQAYPITKDNITKLQQLRGYFRYMKDSGQIRDGFATVANPQSFKAMMSDLEKGERKFRSEEHAEMYYDLLKMYDELADRIEPLYHTKPKSPKASEIEKPEGMSDEDWEEALSMFWQPERTKLRMTQEQWKKNLLKWHKDSHGLTKNDDGSPKVFYHGTGANFETFMPNDAGHGAKAMYFTDSKKTADNYSIVKTELENGDIDGANVMPVHLHMTNPKIIDEIENAIEYKAMPKIIEDAKKKGHDGIVLLNAIDDQGMRYGNGETYMKEYADEDGFRTNTIIVFEPTQIKSIHNKGEFDKYNPNVLYSAGGQLPSHLAVGMAGGLAGEQSDLDGDGVSGTWKDILLGAAAGYGAVKGAKGVAKGISKFEKSVNEDMAKMAGGGTPPKNFMDEQGFYSVLEKTIDEKVGGKVDSVSLAKMLEKNGVKQDEIEWSGLKELMENNEKLTKEEIEETIKSNRLVVEVVEKRSYMNTARAFRALMNDTIKELEDIGVKVESNMGWAEFSGNTKDEKAKELMKKFDYFEEQYKRFGEKHFSDAPKYNSYKLNGGENYRELLFTKPAKLPEDVKFIRADDGYWYAERPPYDGTNVISSGRNSATLKRELTTGFKSSHWDESNILVFTRVDDRKIDGKDTLFVEELQSDWHQGGRKEGYKNPEKEKRVKYLEEYMKSEIDNNPKKSVVELFKNSEYKKASEELLALKNETRSNIPNAPFKKNWHELGLKRMVQEAVANDYDKIAWTTGKQQAERYSLEKTVDTVVYNKDAGVIQATNGAKEVFFKRVANEQEIEDIMGKELTARLLDKKNTTTDGVHVLQGEELKFGGEGMQAFYDEIVPNAAKKLFKKWGVKPKMEELDDVEQMVWSVDITPAMKEDVKKYGQPLYAVGGAVIANEATKGEEQ